MVLVKEVILSLCAWARRCALFCFLCAFSRVFGICFGCSLRGTRSGLLLFSFVLAQIMSLRVWMSVRKVFTSGEGFFCSFPSLHVGESAWVDVLRGCVCRVWVLGILSVYRGALLVLCPPNCWNLPWVYGIGDSGSFGRSGGPWRKLSLRVVYIFLISEVGTVLSGLR